MDKTDERGRDTKIIYVFNDVIERLVEVYEERRLPYASQRRQVP